MARNYFTSNIIVPELLTEKNYEEWSSCMKNYLIGQDLWECCTNNMPPPAEEDATCVWRKKNATVLHVFQISCSSEMFSRIKGINFAKDAWCKLAATSDDMKFLGNRLAREVSKSEVVDWLRGTIPGESTFIERTLYNQFLRGDSCEPTLTFLRNNPYARGAKFFSSGITLLSLLIENGAWNFSIMGIVDIMSEEELEIQDNEGDTALMYAIIRGMTNIARKLIEKNKKLTIIPNNRGIIPVVKACACSNKDMTRLLYFKTPEEILCGDENGSLLLHYCILNKMPDFALDLLQKKSSLAVTCNHLGFNPLFTMSSQTSWFKSEIELPFWKRWIYNGIQVNNAHNIGKKERGIIISLQKFVGIKHIYEQKFIHTCAKEILKCMATGLSTLNANEVVESRVIPAIFQAVEHGLFDFYDEIARANLDLREGQIEIASILHATEYRQDKFIRNLYAADFKTFFLYVSDKGNNNVLLLVAKLAPESSLARISGAALQMQRELQWFKAVESVAIDLKSIVNKEGETPQQVFSREHKELARKGEEWMKQTAQSYSVVSAFIITIMFAAAFTLPGGNNQDSGFPMFLHKKAFMVFMLSDAISLFSASTSVMMFLGILTSRYADEDFLQSLPNKLLIGLISLFVSIATMMVAFSTAVAIMLHGQWWITMLLVVFASIPVIVFLWLQSGQMVGIFNSTYRWRLFEK